MGIHRQTTAEDPVGLSHIPLSSNRSYITNVSTNRTYSKERNVLLRNVLLRHGEVTYFSNCHKVSRSGCMPNKTKLTRLDTSTSTSTWSFLVVVCIFMSCMSLYTAFSQPGTKIPNVCEQYVWWHRLVLCVTATATCRLISWADQWTQIRLLFRCKRPPVARYTVALLSGFRPAVTPMGGLFYKNDSLR